MSDEAANGAEDYGAESIKVLRGLDAVGLRTVIYVNLFPNVLLSLHPDYVMVHRLLPLAFIGVLMNVVSGMLMMLADSYRYVVNDYTFAPKITLITVGAIAALYFSASDQLWKLRPGDDAPATAKWIAVIVFVAWTGVIVCGRLLNYR